MLHIKCRFIWPSGFRGEDFFLNQPIKNKNCLWPPCFCMDRDKMCNLYRTPSIDASYQVSVHLAKGFQKRRLKFEKITDDRRRTPSDGKSSHCLWKGELTLKMMKHNLRNDILNFFKVNSTKYAFRLNNRGNLVLKIVARKRMHSCSNYMYIIFWR